MKFTGKSKSVRQLLGLAASVAPDKDLRPIIENIAISATEDSVEFLATNLAVSVRITTTDVDVKTPGDVLINAKKATQILKRMGRESVTFQQVDGACKVFEKGYRCKLMAADYVQFPEIPPCPDEFDVEIPSSSLRGMINRTMFAASKEANRMSLHGIFLEIADKSFSLISTDGRRMSVTALDVESDVCNSVILPASSMAFVYKLLGDNDDPVQVTIQEGDVVFKFDCIDIFVRSLHGQYPPVKKSIPQQFAVTLELDRKKFIDILDKAKELTTDLSNTAIFEFSDTGLKLSASSQQYGEATVSHDIGTYEYEPITIGFKPTTIKDALTKMSMDTFTMSLNNGDSAIKLDEGKSFSYIANPIKL